MPELGPVETPFAQRLRSGREHAGLTQRGLALRSSIGVRTIRELESGRAHGRIETIQMLADGLGLQDAERAQFIYNGLPTKVRPPGPSGQDESSVGMTAAPRAVNALLGRDIEVEAIVAALAGERRRAVSLCGLPGVGKTRMAAEIAARVDAQLGWPVLWIGLDSGAVSAANLSLSASLRWLAEGRVADVSADLRRLGSHDALLVLDGLTDAALLDDVERLLAYSPGLRVLTTARAPWHVGGSQPTVIGGLLLPGPAACDAGGPELGAVPAVALLVDRLAEVRPGFALTRHNAAEVVALCRLGDGLPFALEILAAHFQVLGLHELVELPDPVLLELSVPARIGQPSHSLAALFDTVVEQLTLAQREILDVLFLGTAAASVNELAGLLDRRAAGVAHDLQVLCGHGVLRAQIQHSDGESVPLDSSALSLPRLFHAYLSTLDPDRLTHIRGGCPIDDSEPILEESPSGLTAKRGGNMSYNSSDELRAAGLIGGQMAPELETFFGTLTKQEVDVLVSTTSRLNAILPDVAAHSQEWTSPETTQEGFDAAMLCACGAWSGSGSNQK